MKRSTWTWGLGIATGYLIGSDPLLRATVRSAPKTLARMATDLAGEGLAQVLRTARDRLDELDQEGLSP